MTIDWSRAGLESIAFEGWAPFARLPSLRVPSSAGAYVIVREAQSEPEFLPASVGGHFKGRDPSVDPAILGAKWITSTPVIYVGKADIRSSGGGLAKRLDEYRRFGEGLPVGHWGGRYIWQLADHADLRVAWKSADSGSAYESALLADFVSQFGRLPFANLRA